MSMISYLASTTLTVIKCDSQNSPTEAVAAGSGKQATASIPSLTSFITTLVQKSNVQTPTLMTSLVYLARLREKLPPMAKGMACTCHRIFLACLIMAAKNLNDSSPKNKYWAKYTMGLFPLAEVNLMEHQLLYLLDWDLRVQPSDLYTHFAPFLLPIKAKLAQQEQQQLFKTQECAASAGVHYGYSASYQQEPTPQPTQVMVQPTVAAPSQVAIPMSLQQTPYSHSYSLSQPQLSAQPQLQQQQQQQPQPQPYKSHQYHGSYPIAAPQQIRHRHSHASLRSKLSAASLRHQHSSPQLNYAHAMGSSSSTSLNTSPRHRTNLNSPSYRAYCATYRTPPISPYRARKHTGSSAQAPPYYSTGSTLSSWSTWSAHDNSVLTNMSSPASEFSTTPPPNLHDLAVAENAAAAASAGTKNTKRKSRLRFWAKDNFSITKRPTLLEYVSL